MTLLPAVYLGREELPLNANQSDSEETCRSIKIACIDMWLGDTILLVKEVVAEGAEGKQQEHGLE